MDRCLKLLVVLASLITLPARAHDIGHCPAVVIDTDMGLDDVVTLALALQSPRVDITALVACEGVAGREQGVERLERMLDLFNRKEIPLYAPVETQRTKAPPPFRSFAERALGRVLAEETIPFRRPFAPEAYVTEGAKTVVLALGPLTNLAAALERKPAITPGIKRVIVAGLPDADGNWNVHFDPEALGVVKASGVPLEFVVPGAGARKPESWGQGDLTIGQGTSVGEGFVKRLLADTSVREHYVRQFDSFHDELVFLYLADPTLFSANGQGNVLAPRNSLTISHLFTRSISDGRQHKARVVFAERAFPDNVFQEDIRQRRDHIIANNGHDEWFAQLLMHELHQHLGVYSVLGVKMGLRAAELLNAPQHAMRIVSHTGAQPPVSCLNDGILVSTGCTPGRGLFSHLPGPPGSVKTTFSYNGRRMTLTIKEEYRRRIRAEIKALSEKYKPEHHGYWDGVRRLGLDIWENWHRRDLFEIVGAADDPPE